MLKTNCTAAAVASFFAVFSVGCAHSQAVTLTSAAAVAPPAPSAPAAPVAAAPVPAVAPVAEAADAPADKVETEPAKPVAKKKPGEPMSFEELTAQLGGEQNLALDIEQTTARAGKGLSSDGYSAVGAAHQAVDTGSGARSLGDIKLSGGLTVTAVRAGVHEGASRLRACYERGLAGDPRLAGRVLVSFSVDENGGVSDVNAESDAIPADVTSCIRAAFSSMTFAAPKSAPARIVYPIDFNKDS
jgi:hypothetical protein